MSKLSNDSPATTASPFVDRRKSNARPDGTMDRRQFGNSYDDLTEEGREFALAIDQYKVQHGRRYINFDEMLNVLRSLGYQRS